MGEVKQHTEDIPDETLTIVVYQGADGDFTLYEDEGDNYNYEKGAFSTIKFIYDDAEKTLSIGDRQGTFEDMPAGRQFNIVLVSKDNAIGLSDFNTIHKVIEYDGTAITENL